MPQKNSGVKLRRSHRNKGKYAAQFYRTAANKLRQIARVKRRKQYWLQAAFKKNGKRVRP